jgi:hypothetical protein
MTTAHALDDALSPELEAIAAAAHDRLQAHAGQDLSAQEAAQRRVAEAAIYPPRRRRSADARPRPRVPRSPQARP